MEIRLKLSTDDANALKKVQKKYFKVKTTELIRILIRKEAKEDGLHKD